MYWREQNVTQQFWGLPYVPGKRFGGTKPVYILTSCNTFSAAEEFAYNLQTLKRATAVGERTGGGAHPGKLYNINNMFDIFIPNGRAINPVTKQNWEGTGIRLDVEIPREEAFDFAYNALLRLEQDRQNTDPAAGHEGLINEINKTIPKRNG